jgi:hypothetical protein
MRFDARHLDADTLRYLRFIDAAAGHGAPGVFHRFSVRPPKSQWGWLGFLFFGGCGVLITFGLSRPQSLIDADLRTHSLTQAVVLGLAVASLTHAAVRAFRPDRPTGLGTFTFADPLHAWVVRGDDVRAYPLAGLEQATGTHHYQGHVYTHSVVTLSTDRGRHKFTLFDLDTAEQFLRFFDVLIAADASDDEPPAPAALGVFARHVATARTIDGAPGPEGAPSPPTPRRVSGHPLAAALAPWVLGLAFGGAAAVLLPGWNAQWLDDYLFGLVPRPPSESIKELEYYLEKRPRGRHAAQVDEWRDERTFIVADRQFREQGDPTGLEAYLADPRNTRHRREAAAALGGK